MLIPIMMRVTSSKKDFSLVCQNSGREKIIVSLTSFNKRIGRVWIVIESILRQTCKPDMIILWLSKEEFPSMECLPKKLLRLQKRGLIINLREGNLMSHKNIITH